MVRPLETLIACKVINLAEGLRESDRRVGAALIEHYNRKTGRCDPGIDRLATLLGYCSRTIIRSTQTLERLGLFEKVRHGGYSNRNFYRPNWSRFATLAAAWDDKMRARASSHPTKMSPGPRQPSHLESDTAVPQTFRANLSQETYSKWHSKEQLGATRLEPPQRALRTTASNDAGRNAAERRWSTDLNEEFRSKPLTYAEVIEAITPEMRAAATDAELRSHGDGLRYIIKQLKLG